jgi:hypothetical protein
MTEETEPGLSFLSLTEFWGPAGWDLTDILENDPILTLDDEPERMVLSALLQASQEELSFIIPRDAEGRRLRLRFIGFLKREVLIN